MLNSIFSNVSSSDFSIVEVLICIAAALVLGGIIALVHTYKNTYTKNFLIALTLLPTIVMAVIMVINGNLGAGIAVAGAFSLIRFRSQPGTAREITSLFLAMGVGFALGMGYLTMAILIVAVVCIAMLVLASLTHEKGGTRHLTVTVPEDVNYESAFDEVFEKFTSKHELISAKTTSMGSLFEIKYTVNLKANVSEKAMIDELRIRNCNLPIVCGRLPEKEYL